MRENSNILILLLSVSTPFLWLIQNNYQIHTTIKYHQYIVAKPNLQHLLFKIKMWFLIKINHLYYRVTSYPIDSVVFQASKSSIGLNLDTYGLKAPSTP